MKRSAFSPMARETRVWLLAVVCLALFACAYGRRRDGPPAPADACLPHLSCQTCLQEDDCVWCAGDEICATPDFEGPNTTCADAMRDCDCDPFKNCNDCLKPGYCGWCETLKECYGAGDRPVGCKEFRDQVCSERIGFSSEWVILAAMVIFVLAGFAGIATIMGFKIVNRPNMENSEALDDTRAMRNMGGSNNYLTDDDTADESDGLLSPSK